MGTRSLHLADGKLGLFMSPKDLLNETYLKNRLAQLEISAVYTGTCYAAVQWDADLVSIMNKLSAQVHFSLCPD